MREIIIISPEDLNNKLCRFPGNRPVKINRELLKSINKYNRAFNPILIGPPIKSTESIDGGVLEEKEYYPILDGQHRALVLHELQLPIVCFLDNTIDYTKHKTALAALQQSKSWTIDNFVGFLIEYGSDEALKLSKLIEEYKDYSSTKVAEVFSLNDTKNAKKLIEANLYELDILIGNKVFEASRAINLKSTSGLRALKYLWKKNDGFSINRLIEVVKNKEIEYSANDVEIIEQILPLYNKGVFEDEMLEYDAPKKKRWFPNDVKFKAINRANGRCEYIDPNNHRCEETENLEYDHDLPYSKGGANTLENCQVLCLHHNRSKGAK